MGFKNPKHSDWFRSWQIKFYNSKSWKTLRNRIRTTKRMRCDMCGRLIHGKSIMVILHNFGAEKYLVKKMGIIDKNNLVN